MVRTDQDFQDGFVIDVFSPKARTVVVSQNAEPLQARFISGTDGQNFVSLSNYSYVVRTNDSANDMIAKIEIPFRPTTLNTMNIPQANTYVAQLSPDSRSWVIDMTARNVHSSENNTRIMQMTSIDGEYILVGRAQVDTANIFMQFGQGEARTAKLASGPGISQSEWIDGIRFNVQADQMMAFNVDLKPGINPGTLPANTQALNSYAWVVNSSMAFGKIDCTMSVPCMYFLPFPSAISSFSPHPNCSLQNIQSTEQCYKPCDHTASPPQPCSQSTKDRSTPPQDNFSLSWLTTKWYASYPRIELRFPR